jgi:hypothetical protein
MLAKSLISIGKSAYFDYFFTDSGTVDRCEMQCRHRPGRAVAGVTQLQLVTFRVHGIGAPKPRMVPRSKPLAQNP